MLCPPISLEAHANPQRLLKNTKGERDAIVVGHVPDSLAVVLCKPLLIKEIKMTCRVSVSVQGGVMY